RSLMLSPLVREHTFRMFGGKIQTPCSFDAAVPSEFRTMIGFGDMTTAVLALVALIALRLRWRYAIGLVWLFLIVGLLDTVNAIIQSMRFSVFTNGLGFNWVIVTAYVPALLVSSVLILIHLRRQAQA